MQIHTQTNNRYTPTFIFFSGIGRDTQLLFENTNYRPIIANIFKKNSYLKSLWNNSPLMPSAEVHTRVVNEATHHYCRKLAYKSAPGGQCSTELRHWLATVSITPSSPINLRISMNELLASLGRVNNQDLAASFSPAELAEFFIIGKRVGLIPQQPFNAALMANIVREYLTQLNREVTPIAAHGSPENLDEIMERRRTRFMCA